LFTNFLHTLDLEIFTYCNKGLLHVLSPRHIFSAEVVRHPGNTTIGVDYSGFFLPLFISSQFNYNYNYIPLSIGFLALIYLSISKVFLD